jgi:hypothetical protein
MKDKFVSARQHKRTQQRNNFKGNTTHTSGMLDTIIKTRTIHNPKRKSERAIAADKIARQDKMSKEFAKLDRLAKDGVIGVISDWQECQTSIAKIEPNMFKTGVYNE